MPKQIEKILLFCSDFITINLAYWVWVTLRFQLGFYTEQSVLQSGFVMLILFLYWLLLFIFFGLYKSWYAQSRFDEFVVVLKTISIGVILIFVLTFDFSIDLRNLPSISRIIIISYWLMLVFFVSAGRILLRTIQRKLLEKGIGRRNTLIIGWNSKAQNLYDKVKQAPALGYEIVGFISNSRDNINKKYKDCSVVGTLKSIASIVKSKQVEVILISVKVKSPKQIVNIISRCDNLPVSLKIVPDLYDIVMGYGRTNQIYGMPLIEILPQMMPAWEKQVKRLIDIVASLIVLVLFSPFWFLIAAAIKIESRGPVFFKQKRIGLNERVFKIYKFRSMVDKAEKSTGPVWAGENDPRITFIGNILRKLRIDEIPQFINVLFNDMSLVGPRPERPYFVNRLKNEIPFYSRRHRMKPGITGWAQIKGGYDTTIKNVKKKLQYDLFYLENMSLRMDLKIIIRTIYTMIAGRGR
ncbi:undecaprenyl-phosphate glucose phosphotransferase [candidate division KSB1 bacterium 4572_119]|nr:MAG: undecaprenyl-phosphate glucose phosphotransferase [candidate division KSB1 bacterium 4572_119]